MSRRALAVAVPLLWVAALGSAAGAIWCKHRARELFVQLEALNARRDATRAAIEAANSSEPIALLLRSSRR